ARHAAAPARPGAVGPRWSFSRGPPGDGAARRKHPQAWGASRVSLAGGAPRPPGVPVPPLPTETALASAYQRRLADQGSIDTAVVCNPADLGRGGMSGLAPWIALQKRAALLLTRPDGKDVPQVVSRALRKRSLRRL